MTPTSMTGLEVLQAILAGKLPMPSIAETMPMQVIEIGKGFVKFTAKADKRHLNPAGGVHGGFFATVLDSVLGNAVFSELEAGIGYGTVDLAVKMLAPLPMDEEVIAEARVVHLSRRMGVAEGTIRNQSGKLIAHGTTTCLILRPEAST
ncbi:MAG: PaaI family thioesterase [Moraxellaceae bacterium]|nr:PaaI family thioesterase [Moraxellaceae bacterium]